METKASYVLVGAFVLGLIAAGVIFALWVSGSTQRADDIMMTVQFEQDVTGLNKEAFVRYQGIPIGRVRDIRLDPKNPEFVLVKIVVRPDAQIYPDFVAAMEQRGLTGSPFIQLKRPPDPNDRQKDVKPVPAGKMSAAMRNRRIPGTSTQLQKVFDELPKAIASIRNLAERATSVVAKVEDTMVGPSGINVGSIVNSLEKAVAAFTSFTDDAKIFANEARKVAEEIRPAARELTDTIRSVQEMADKAGSVFDEKNRKALTQILKNVEVASADVSRFVREAEKRASDLEPSLKELPRTLRNFGDFSNSATRLSDQASTFFDETNRTSVAQILALAETAAKDISSFVRETSNVANEVRPAIKNLGQGLSQIADTVRQVEDGAKAFGKMSDQVAAMVEENRRSLGLFMNTGLYEVSQFVTDGQRLIKAFNRLIRRIENDPSGFFFGGRGGLTPGPK
ncbi:MAG: MlaD family protein [Rhodospirillaceae bacterium]|nr:MlaD family protein [Rhodospirillaceae bacterium]